MATLRNDEERTERQELFEESERLYEQYGKPLEAEHWGEYVAISRDGRMLLGASADEVGRAANDTFGPGNFIFQVGPRVTNKWL